MIPVGGPVREGVGPARLALLRDPPLGPLAITSSTTWPPGAGGERRLKAKNRHNAATIGTAPAGALALPLRARARRPAPLRRAASCRRGRRQPVHGLGRRVRGGPARRRVHRRLLRAGRTGGHRVPRAAAPVLLDLPARVLGARAVLEGARPSPTSRCSTAPRSRASSGGCSGYGSAAASSTTAARSWSGRWSAIGSGATLSAGSILQSHSLEDGTFKSDYITIGDRLHHRHRRLRPLRSHDGRRRRARRRLLPHEGRARPAGSQWRGNPAASIQASPSIPAATAPAPGPARLSSPGARIAGQRPSGDPHRARRDQGSVARDVLLGGRLCPGVSTAASKPLSPRPSLVNRM